MHTDRPIERSDKDRLGFTEMAHHLADAVLSDDLSSGFVFGIEGAWGSGKSSLINLTQEELRQCPNSPKPQIIEFRPWMVGRREDLLKELFNQISGVVHNVVDHPHAGDARRLLKIYAQVASGLAGIASAAEVFEIPLAARAKRFLRSTGKNAGEMAEPSLGDIRDNLKEVLNGAKARIIIFIDDLDRLDPPEVVEVLRLMRAVADFPNVVYITAYDADRIAMHLKTALGTDDGGTYLEKIVQVSFRIPGPMIFDIVNWFREKAAELLDVAPGNSVESQRFSQTVQTWAPMLLATPRDVVRVCNALHLNAVPVKVHVDPGDMTFLQLIRVKCPALFRWVEEYVVTLARCGDYGHLSQGATTTKAAELLKIIGGDEQKRSQFTQALSISLPGIQKSSQGESEDGYSVFVFPFGWSPDQWQPFSAEKRLASRHHFRLYFSFSLPVGGISDAEAQSFITRTKDDPVGALASFREMAQTNRPQGGVLAEVLLSRILERRYLLDPVDIPPILEVLGKGMDVLARNTQKKPGYHDFVSGDHASIFGLIQRLDETSRETVLRKLFQRGMSYSWLCEIIREATFQHGLYGNRPMPEEYRLLTTGEFEMIRNLYLSIIHKEDPKTILSLPHLLEFLLSWLQLGEKEEVRKWVASQSNTDERFLELLEHMGRSRTNSAAGSFLLKREELKEFFDDISAVVSRLARLMEDESLTPEFRERAKKLKAQLDDG